MPAYFELTHKYPVMLHVDAESRILDRYPFGGLTGLLQPTVVRIPSTLNLVSGASTVGSTKTIAPAEKVDSEELLAFFRRSQALPLAKVFMSRSHDNGQTWTPAQAIGIPNGDASVVAWADNDHIWLVANPEPYHRRSIASFQLPLPLGEASPILPTRILDEVTENAPGPKEFSYPSFATTTDGRLHLAYTADGRSRIRHRVWSSLVPNPPVTSKQP